MPGKIVPKRNLIDKIGFREHPIDGVIVSGGDVIDNIGKVIVSGADVIDNAGEVIVSGAFGIDSESVGEHPDGVAHWLCPSWRNNLATSG